MALALNKENFLLHKLHSLSGIIPVGFYMCQHLTLNSFSFAGPEYYNGVINFFESIPKHVLLALEIFVIAIPILFHAIYGMFIAFRAKQNFVGTKFGWSQNRMFVLQRISGIYLFFALIVHVSTTTLKKYATGNSEAIKWQGMHDMLTSSGYIWLVFYMLLVLTASYHLAYGIWNFCIRWGITISDAAQIRIQKFAFGFFVVITMLGWVALWGFLPERVG